VPFPPPGNGPKLVKSGSKYRIVLNVAIFINHPVKKLPVVNDGGAVKWILVIGVELTDIVQKLFPVDVIYCWKVT
jgi:hypothetical protein